MKALLVAFVLAVSFGCCDMQRMQPGESYLAKIATSRSGVNRGDIVVVWG